MSVRISDQVQILSLALAIGPCTGILVFIIGDIKIFMVIFNGAIRFVCLFLSY